MPEKAGVLKHEIATVFFVSNPQAPIQQIGVVFKELGSNPGMVNLKRLISEQGGGCTIKLGPKGIQFSLQEKIEAPHRKISMRVRDIKLLAAQAAGAEIVLAALPSRLQYTGVEVT